MDLVTLIFDLLTLKLVRESYQRWDLRSEFGHARPLGSRVTRYVRDGRTDRQKQTYYGRGIKTATHGMHAHEKLNARKDRIGYVRALRI